METLIPEINQYREPIVKKPSLNRIDLDGEKKMSQLSAETVMLFEQNSAGLVTIEEFSRLRKQNKNTGGYALGLSNDRDLYTASCRGFNLKHWEEGFKEFNIPLDLPNTFVSKYLSKITSTGKPIAFFIPQKIYSHGLSNITRREIDWYIEHTQEGKAKNTHFVFGLYSSIDLQTYLTTLPHIEESRISKMAQILADYDSYLKH